jgi:hypothetical protein
MGRATTSDFDGLAVVPEIRCLRAATGGPLPGRA